MGKQHQGVSGKGGGKPALPGQTPVGIQGSKVQKPAHKKTSLKAMKQQVQALQPVRKSDRVRRPSEKAGPEVEKRLKEVDETVGVLDPGANYDDEDDTDYLQSVPGRPGQFTTTWNETYGNRVLFAKGYSIDCAEPVCQHTSRTIVMNSKCVELNAGSTPHGKPRKPPVCHKVSWAALETTMLNMESKASIASGKPCLFTDAFRRRVCWFPSNLGPGHNACNSAGTKTTAHTVGPKELDAANTIVEQVKVEFNNVGVWQ